MANTALVVHLDIDADKFDEFVSIARTHGARSIELEEGCLRFDVLVPQAPANHVILVEVYTDEAALTAHWESPHMEQYLDKVQDMITSRLRYQCTL